MAEGRGRSPSAEPDGPAQSADLVLPITGPGPHAAKAAFGALAAAKAAFGTGDGAPERHEVAVLALPHVVAFELGLPHRFLGGAVDADDRPYYRVRTCTVDGGPVRTR